MGGMNYLLRSAMLKTTLNKEIAEAVDHQWIRLRNDRLHNLKFLIRGPHLEFLFVFSTAYFSLQ
jgi:hypothetical protein